MAAWDDRLERLISRRLDGEITQAEDLELNKMIIRSPEARRLSEDLQREDDLLGAALREALSAEPAAMPSMRTRKPYPYRVRVRRWPVSVAVAAAIAAFVLGPSHLGLWGPAQDAASSPRAITSDPVRTAGQAGAISSGPPVAGDAGVPGYRRRAVDRNVLGVLGEDGKTLYLLEMNRTRTATVPLGGDL